MTENFEQCKNERGLTRGAETLALKEGCQIYGHLEVNRVRTFESAIGCNIGLTHKYNCEQMGGNFHVAPGKSFSLNHVHIHDVHPFSSSTFNMSHTINHISFGQRIEFANTHPMDNMEVIAKDGKFNC